MEHTQWLIERAHQGDKAAREQLVEENLGLVFIVAKRFAGRGTETEDLVQIGSIGLIKAIDHFDLSFDVKFSTYAVPMIAGEIKRHLRDDGMIKVSRSLKETAYQVSRVKESLEKKLGREPGLNEISEELGIGRENLILAMDAAADVESLQKTVYQGDGNEITLEERIPEEKNENEKILDKIRLEEMLRFLEPDERRLIYMRYFQDMTQNQIAQILGISQVQTSRLEKRILKKMRDSQL
ncbi:MAG: SigF/SigG family RNA polymerase sporulation sigma factor [Eubacteriales bacterium]|nr:SigF/SigG family RNA polymerase sporulation sigma factor [Eubacteriales bacterium]